MDMIFKFAESAHLGGDPQAVGEKLHAIRKSRGRLVPSDVVEEAKAEDSVLHRYFDWNNREAAQKWRIVQARDLISAIVTVEVGDKETLPVRSFVSVDNSYEPVYEVMSDADMRQKALADVEASIVHLQSKIRAYTELRDVLKALERVREIARRHVGPRRVESERGKQRSGLSRQASTRRAVAVQAR